MSTENNLMKKCDDDIVSLTDIDSCSFSSKCLASVGFMRFITGAKLGVGIYLHFFQHGELTIFIYEQFGQ